MLHKTSLVTSTNILFIVVNISTEDIYLRKGETLGFLEPTDIDSNDITTKTVFETVFQNKDCNCDPTSGT